MENLLIRIQHSLILKSKFMHDIGLFNGKMGIVITFATLYIKSGNILYYDIMEDLLEDVIDNIYMDIRPGFEMGIAGIGWGIEYLRTNGLVEDNPLCLYEEINKKIMEIDIRRIAD